MVQIIIIKKEGKLTYDKITDLNELYKKCGFRKVDGFEKIKEYKDETCNTIELWGKMSGKGIIKNQYVFPTPIDKKIYGNCSLMMKSGDQYIDICEEVWNKTCDTLTNMKNQDLQMTDSDKKTKLEFIKQKLDNINKTISSFNAKEEGDEIMKEASNFVKDERDKNKKIKKKDNKTDSVNLETEQVLDVSESDTASDSSTESDDYELKEETYLYSDEEEEEINKN